MAVVYSVHHQYQHHHLTLLLLLLKRIVVLRGAVDNVLLFLTIKFNNFLPLEKKMREREISNPAWHILPVLCFVDETYRKIEMVVQYEN